MGVISDIDFPLAILEEVYRVDDFTLQRLLRIEENTRAEQRRSTPGLNMVDQ